MTANRPATLVLAQGELPRLPTPGQPFAPVALRAPDGEVLMVVLGLLLGMGSDGDRGGHSRSSGGSYGGHSSGGEHKGVVWSDRASTCVPFSHPQEDFL